MRKQTNNNKKEIRTETDVPLHTQIQIPTVEDSTRMCLLDGGVIIKVFPAHYSYEKASSIARNMECEVGQAVFKITFEFTGTVRVLKSRRDFIQENEK